METPCCNDIKEKLRPEWTKKTFGKFAFIAFVLFSIGLPVLLVGCNPNVSGGCPIRHVEDGILQNVTIYVGRCHTGSDMPDYDCYRLELTFRYDKDDTCQYKPIGGYKYEESAYEEADSYSIGAIYTILVYRDPSVCSFNDDVALFDWYVGIIFLSLDALFMLICCAHWAKEYYDKNRQNQYVTSQYDNL